MKFVTLPAISLWQPWASAAVTELKAHETRSWPCPPKYVGRRVAIHASARPAPVLPERVDALIARKFGADWRRTLPRGGVVGTALIVSSRLVEASRPFDANDLALGDWTPGRWVWRLEDKVWFEDIVPWKGRQGWFEVEVPEYERSCWP